MTWLLLSVGSALFQVMRNMIMKRLGHALDETINVWGRFTFILPFAAIPILINGVPPLLDGMWFYAVIFAICQLIGTQCLSMALKVSDISLVTALWKLSVIILLIWSVLYYHESPSPWGVAGVIVSVVGVYLINIGRAKVSWLAPLVALVKDPGQRWTLGSAFFYAPSVVFIREIAVRSNPTFAVFIGYVFCSLFVTPLVLYRSARHFKELGKHWWSFVGLGAFAAISTQLGTTAYTLTIPAYVEAVKQLEILIALGIGYFIFKEGARIRAIWPGCLVMLAGIVMLILGK